MLGAHLRGAFDPFLFEMLEKLPEVAEVGVDGAARESTLEGEVVSERLRPECPVALTHAGGCLVRHHQIAVAAARIRPPHRACC
jgi:hypothetical protein